MTTTKINQKEYLKKYFSNDDRKKKKKKKFGQKTVKIIDDDVDLDKIRAIQENEFDIINNTEDAPQIVGIVDERGAPDFSDKARWRIIADDGLGEISIRENTLNKRDEDEDDQSFERDSKENNTSKNKVKASGEISSQGKSESFRKINQEKIDSDSDLSIPRKSPSSSEDKSRRKRNMKSEKKKKKKKRDDDDLSPPRSKKSKSNKRRHYSDSDSNSDLSLPRNKSKRERSSNKNRNSSSESDRITEKSSYSKKKTLPERNSRNKKKNYDSDLSPPRRDKNKNEKASGSRRKRKNYSDEDLSPPRIRRSSREENLSRSMKDDRRHEKPSRSDERFENRRDFNRDSPARRNRKLSESPQRRPKKSRWNRESRSRSPEVSKDKRMTKTLDGKTAGLQDAKALREETAAHKRREAEIFKKLTGDASGAGQSVVIRDRKTGRRRDLQAEAAVEREKEERQQEINEQYAKWGRGLKQQNDREEKLKDDMHEMSKPLARYKDDKDLDRVQKNKLLDEDPMLQFGQDKLIEQGVLKIGTKSNSRGPPNRFGIPPGDRWDGVDRSNGYEKKWFEAQNSKKATAQEAYAWSTSDM